MMMTAESEMTCFSKQMLANIQASTNMVASKRECYTSGYNDIFTCSLLPETENDTCSC